MFTTRMQTFDQDNALIDAQFMVHPTLNETECKLWKLGFTPDDLNDARHARYYSWHRENEDGSTTDAHVTNVYQIRFGKQREGLTRK